MKGGGPSSPVVDRPRIAPRWRWVAGLFLTGVIVRLAWLAVHGIPDTEGGDAEEYIALAGNFARGLGLTSDGVNPSTYRPPLFSCLLGIWCWLFRSTSLATMVIFQIVVQSAVASLTYLLVLKLQANRRYASMGGLFVALYPFLVLATGFIFQEPTQMLVAAILGIAVVAWCREPTAGRAVAVGAAVGLGALAKSPFLLLPVVMALLYCFGRDYRRRMPLSGVIAILLVAAAVVAPWTLRNHRVSGGRLIPINSQNVTLPIWLMADRSFVVRDSPASPAPGLPGPERGILLSYGNRDGIDRLRRKNEELLAAGVTGADVVQSLAAYARSYLWSHPGYVLKKTLRGVILLCSPDATLAWSRGVALRVAAILMIHLPLAAGLFAGLVRSLRDRHAGAAILSLFTLMYLLVHAPFAVSGGRYSVPVLPLMIAVAGYGFWGAGSAAIFDERGREVGRQNVAAGRSAS